MTPSDMEIASSAMLRLSEHRHFNIAQIQNCVSCIFYERKIPEDKERQEKIVNRVSDGFKALEHEGRL